VKKMEFFNLESKRLISDDSRLEGLDAGMTGKPLNTNPFQKETQKK